jgi:periplasmic protein TonB
MFEEFDPKTKSRDKRRLGASLAVSSVVYLALAGGVVAASAAARQAVKEEELVQIEVAAPPEPEPPPQEPPPPPPEAPPPSAKPKVQRQALELPKEIPQEKPKEADAPLAEAPAAGTGQEGFSDGVAGGTGTAPAPAALPPSPAPAPKATGPVHLPESATPPVAKSGNTAPTYPEEARKAGLQTVVVAKVTISAAGKVTNVEVLRGPEIFHAPVKAALMTWLYEPARLPDGTAISVFRIVQLPFKLENM